MHVANDSFWVQSDNRTNAFVGTDVFKETLCANHFLFHVDTRNQNYCSEFVFFQFAFYTRSNINIFRLQAFVPNKIQYKRQTLTVRNGLFSLSITGYKGLNRVLKILHQSILFLFYTLFRRRVSFRPSITSCTSSYAQTHCCGALNRKNCARNRRRYVIIKRRAYMEFSAK